MKKFFALLTIAIIGSICFAETFKTGEAMEYFPKGAPKVSSKGGDSSKCFITKIAKANGYPAGIFELQITSCDWIGATVFPIYFSYIVKQGDTLDLVETKSVYLGSENVSFIIKSISDNKIELEKANNNYKEISPSEDSL